MKYGRPSSGIDPAQVPGLEQLDSTTMERLTEVGRLVHLPRGWTPIRAQEPSDEAYFVLAGCVQVVDGDTTVATVCQGQFLGEMGLINGSLRSARVTVTEPVVAIAWPSGDFQRLREEHADFDELVTSVAADRLKSNHDRSGS